MNKEPQCFTTIDEQIKILKSRNLIIKDEERAKLALSAYGYYGIINGYKEPYIIKENDKEYYKDGVTFDQIHSLFIFDHHIRNTTMMCMLDVEEQLRAITAYVIAEAFSSEHKEYLKPENYRDRKVKDAKFSLNSILDVLKSNLSSGKDPIKYHMDTYNNVPPWVLFKGTYMNTLVNFIKLQKAEQKENIIMSAYGIERKIAELPGVKAFFTDSLFMFLEYRNLAAHGGRIYNYNSSIDLCYNKSHFEDISLLGLDIDKLLSNYGISKLLTALTPLINNDPLTNLGGMIDYQLSNHVSNYPDDMPYLFKSTGLYLDGFDVHTNDGTIIRFSSEQVSNPDGSLKEEVRKFLRESAATKE